MGFLQSAALMAATITVGLMAGLFAGFAYAVMPGLRRASDQTLVETMQRINVAILNGWFFVSFVGALVFTALAAVLHLRGDGRAALPWIAAGLVLYVVVLAITAAINIPLNNQLASVDPGDDLAAARERFETRWTSWNAARAVASTASFGCLAWALVLHGRAFG